MEFISVQCFEAFSANTLKRVFLKELIFSEIIETDVQLFNPDEFSCVEFSYDFNIFTLQFCCKRQNQCCTTKQHSPLRPLERKNNSGARKKKKLEYLMAASHTTHVGVGMKHSGL